MLPLLVVGFELPNNDDDKEDDELGFLFELELHELPELEPHEELLDPFKINCVNYSDIEFICQKNH